MKNFMCKKFFSVIIFSVLILIISSCQTIEEVIYDISFGLENFGEALSKSNEKSQKDYPSMEGTRLPSLPKPQSQTSTKITNFSTPSSYEKAYSYRTDKADESMKAIKKNSTMENLRKTNPESYIREVCKKINEVSQNDFEKAKLAHDITALLIKYDAASFWAGKIPNQDYYSVLKTGLAVCEGYATVYKQFCDELKIPCHKVHGYARGVGTSLETEKNIYDSNHAWNIVQVEGKWYLVDTTWDSGYMNGRTSVQRYNTDWLFLKPEHFIYTHFPEEKSYQLLKDVLSFDEFFNLPDLQPKFFDLAENFSPDLKKYNLADGTFVLNYEMKDGYSFTFEVANLSSNQIVKNRVLVEDDCATFSLPQVAKYSVSIFYWKNGEQRGNSCGSFLIESTGTNSVRYPTLYSITGGTAKILEPKTMPLVAGQTYNFKIKVEGKKIVTVICGNKYNKLTDDGTGIFSGEVTIPKNIKEISIGVSNKENSSYQIYANYVVK